MATQAGFILKVLILSAAISVLIKYGGPTLDIAATPAKALVAVFLPTLIVAIALLWRTFQQRHMD